MTDPVRRFGWNCDRLLVLGVLTSLSISLFLLWNYYCISIDGVYYVEAAKNFYLGDFAAALSSVYPPGYPALVAVFYGFFHDWEQAGQAVSLLSSVLLLFPLYGLLHSMYGKTIAAIGCFLVAVNPFLAMYSVHVRTESLFVLLAVLSLYVFHHGMERRNLKDFFVGGLLVGCAYLVRPEAVGLVMIVPGVLFLRWWIKKEWGFIWIAQASAVLMAGFLIFAGPYVVYLSAESGQWVTLSRKSGVTLGVSLREAGLWDEEIRTDFPTRASVSLPNLIRRHPWVYTKKFLKDIAVSFGAYLEALHYSYVPFLLIGLMAVFRERPWERKDFLLFAYLVYFFVGFAAIYAKRRYSIQLVPISMGWTAMGVLWCWSWAKRNWPERTARLALVAVGLLFLSTTLPKTLDPVSEEKAYLKDAGRFIRQRHGSANLTIVAFDDRVAFYAGAKAVMLRYYSAEADLVSQLHQRKADFLAVDPERLQKRFPHLLQSLAPTGLRVEGEFVGSHGDRLVIYRLT